MRYLINTIIILLLHSITPLFSQTTLLQFSSMTVPAGKGPRSVILIDLDRDGNRDLAVANIQGSTISLIFRDNSGIFSLQDSIATIHKAPHAIVAGDFNEDGLLDAVTANRDSNSVGIFLGDGAGGFSSPAFFPTGKGPRWIAVADFNEDGHADIAVTNRDDDNVTVLLGDGAGSFVKSGDIYTGDGPVPIAAGDFNNDGFIDLVVGNDLSDSLVVLTGDGTGGFVISSAIQVGMAPKNIAVGDLNQDGIADIAVASLLDGKVTVLYSDGLGGFTSSFFSAGAGSFAVLIEDFDGDGKNDLGVVDGVDNNFVILLNDGIGGFAEAQTFPVGLAPHAAVSGDFNGDGLPDLAVPNTGDNSVTILLNKTPSQETVHEVAIIQKLYSDFFPDPVILPVGQPIRLHVTTDSREHVNRLRILPFIDATDVVRVGAIMTIGFTSQEAGTFQIQNIGHGFTGDIIFVQDSTAVDDKVIELGKQQAALIHSNAQSQIIHHTVRVLKDIPVTIYNISLDDQHWVSIEPWVTAPPSSAQGNVLPGNVTTFEFTPDMTGSFDIQHTVHGFKGTLIVIDPLKTGVEDEIIIPRDFVLHQNFPNPFNPFTTIEFSLSRSGTVEINIYDVMGRFIRSLVSGVQTSGSHTVEWDGKNASGNDVGSGIYFYQLRTESFKVVKRMLLIK